MAVVYIPTPLRQVTQGQSKVPAVGKTLAEVIADLESRYPGLAEKIYDPQGEIKPFVNIFVSGQECRTLEGKQTPIPDGEEIFIIPAMAGGARVSNFPC